MSQVCTFNVLAHLEIRNRPTPYVLACIVREVEAMMNRNTMPEGWTISDGRVYGPEFMEKLEREHARQYVEEALGGVWERAQAEVVEAYDRLSQRPMEVTDTGAVVVDGRCYGHVELVEHEWTASSWTRMDMHDPSSLPRFRTKAEAVQWLAYEVPRPLYAREPMAATAPTVSRLATLLASPLPVPAEAEKEGLSPGL